MSDISLCGVYKLKKNIRLENAINQNYEARETMLCPLTKKSSKYFPKSEKQFRLLFSNKINCREIFTDSTQGFSQGASQGFSQSFSQDFSQDSIVERGGRTQEPVPVIKTINTSVVFNKNSPSDSYNESLYKAQTSNNNYNIPNKATKRYTRVTNNVYDEKLRQKDKKLKFVGKSNTGFNKSYLLGYNFKNDKLMKESCVYIVTVETIKIGETRTGETITEKKFFINGIQQKFLILNTKGKHIFILKSPSLSEYDFRFSTLSDGSHNDLYKTQDDAILGNFIEYDYNYKQITINLETLSDKPNLYYYDTKNERMGAEMPITNLSETKLLTNYFNDIDWHKIINNNSVLITHVPQDVNNILKNKKILDWELQIHDLFHELRSDIGGWRTEYFIIKEESLNFQSRQIIDTLSQRFGYQLNRKLFTGSIQHYPYSIITTVIPTVSPSDDDILLINSLQTSETSIPETYRLKRNIPTRIVSSSITRGNNPINSISKSTIQQNLKSNLLRKLRYDTVHEYFHIHEMRLSGGRIHKNPIITISNEWEMPWLVEGVASIYTRYFLNDYEYNKCERYHISSTDTFWTDNEYTQLNILRNDTNNVISLFKADESYAILVDNINNYDTWHTNDISLGSDYSHNAYITYVLYLMKIVFKATGSHRLLFYTFWENLKEDIDTKGWTTIFTETFYDNSNNNNKDMKTIFDEEMTKYGLDKDDNFMTNFFKLVEKYLRSNEINEDLIASRLIPYELSFIEYTNDYPPWPGYPRFIKKYAQNTNYLDYPPWPGTPYFCNCEC